MSNPARRTPTEADRRAAETLWRYHQMGHQPAPCDAAIGLGSHDLGVAEHAARLYHDGLFPVIVFSGADNPTMREKFPDGESVAFGRRAIELGVPPEAVLYEPAATNTGKNISLSRRVLEGAGIVPSSIMLISMPYMERRGYATCRKVWPEVTAVCSSEQVAFDAYVKAIGDEALVIDQLVGDSDRVIKYPALGYAIEQPVPADARAALEHLVTQGYDSKLLR